MPRLDVCHTWLKIEMTKMRGKKEEIQLIKPDNLSSAGNLIVWDNDEARPGLWRLWLLINWRQGALRVTSAWNQTDFQPRGGLWGCQCRKRQISLLLFVRNFPNVWICMLGFFFFLAIRHVMCEVWHMLHLLSPLCAKSQSGAKIAAVAGFRVQAGRCDSLWSGIRAAFRLLVCWLFLFFYFLSFPKSLQTATIVTYWCGSTRLLGYYCRQLSASPLLFTFCGSGI